MKKDILTLLDLDKKDVDMLIRRALELKKDRSQGASERPLLGKTLGLIFDKPSTRTRISFEAAMVQLGGTPIFISAKDSQMARNEPVRDTARVLSRYLDGLAIRTFSDDRIREFADYSTIPVINALTDLYHPIQVLSDVMTVVEAKGGYQDLRIVWVGDGNNVAHSWINAAAVLDLELILACPEGYQPDAAVLDRAVQKGGGKIRVVQDPAVAVRQADVLYTDVWASMGQEEQQTERVDVFSAYQVNRALVDAGAEDVIVMHCLPAHRGEEISEEVLEGERSVVWDQSENKLHMHKAVLEWLIGK